MQYVEVQSLEKHAEKIEKQLNLILTTKPGIYAKTKDRYKQLAYSLLKSAEMISSILEEESLVPQMDMKIDDEFNELDDFQAGVDLQGTVQDVHEKIDNCSQFTQSSSEHTSGSISGVLSNKEVIRRFASVIEECANQNFEYPEVAKCATLLHKWMQCRFFPDIRNPKFKYSLKHLPTWITYIIIAFGKYKKEDRVEEFINIVDKWTVEIQTNLSNTYAVPYEVFELMKSNDANDFTVEAVLISDILLETSLYKLTESSMPKSYACFSSSPVLDEVKIKNPQLLTILRTRFAKQRQLMSQFNFMTYD